MNDGFAWWLVILGIAVGVAVVWLMVVRLPRSEGDVDDEELVREAEWISRTIHTYGGVAPEPLVEEVLELHRQYLTGAPAEPVVDATIDDGAEASEQTTPADQGGETRLRSVGRKGRQQLDGPGVRLPVQDDKVG